jgi:uncharacterized membrane protein YccC
MKMIHDWRVRLGIRRASLLNALLIALASCLAFATAIALHIENPYWAAMPAWVISQATRGLLLERGFFRVLGTLGGAAFGLALLHLTHEPVFIVIALGLWVAASATFTHVLRGVHAYGALLCGITAAVVLCPALHAPAHALPLALARIECTLIGVLWGTVVGSAFTPLSDRQLFYGRVGALACDALDFAAGALRQDIDGSRERRILADISEAEASASLVSAGSVDGYRRLRHVHALVYASVELMAAARSLKDHASGAAFSEQLSSLAETLRARPAGRIPDPAWNVAIECAAGISPRIERALTQLMAAELALFTDPDSADSRSFGRKFVYLSPHYNRPVALRLGATCGLAAVLVAGVALASGWQAGTLAALGVCIFGMILSTSANPRTQTLKMSIGVVAGAATGALYRLCVQPAVVEPTWIVLSLVPILLTGALARSVPLLLVSSLDFTMCFLLASQIGLPATGRGEVLEGTFALIAGSLLVTLVIWVAPRRDAARERARELGDDLERLVGNTGAGTEEWGPQAARHVLRLILHLCRPGVESRLGVDEVLPVINLGHGIIRLQTLAREEHSDPAVRETLDLALATLRQARGEPMLVAGRLKAQAEVLHSSKVEDAQLLAECLASLSDNLGATAPLLALSRA